MSLENVLERTRNTFITFSHTSGGEALLRVSWIEKAYKEYEDTKAGLIAYERILAYSLTNRFNKEVGRV